MAYSKELIKNAVERFLDGEDIEKISKETGLSKEVLYSWITPEIGSEDKDFQKKVSMKVRELIEKRELYEAQRICERFGDNRIIQSQLVTILITKRKFDKAKEICKKFSGHIPMQSQLVTLLVKEGNFEEAQRICERFPNHIPLQSQLITILKNQGRLEEAKKICARFPNDAGISSKLESILNKESKLEAGEMTLGQMFSREISQIIARIGKQLKLEGSKDKSDIETLKLIGQSGENDFRAKMQLISYLKRYGMNEVIEERLQLENEIYQDIYRLVLFSQDNPDFSKNKLTRSKLVKDIKHKIMLKCGDEEYASSILNKAMGMGIEEPCL